jgi:uncharacterized protein (DUF488 family)
MDGDAASVLGIAPLTRSRIEILATAPIFTIGHSNHPFERLVQLLSAHGVTAVGDVRSTPYSRANPHFNREFLQEKLKESGIV